MRIIRISWEVIFQKAILHNFLNLTIAKGHGLVVKICTVHHNYCVGARMSSTNCAVTILARINCGEGKATC